MGLNLRFELLDGRQLRLLLGREADGHRAIKLIDFGLFSANFVEQFSEADKVNPVFPSQPPELLLAHSLFVGLPIGNTRTQYQPVEAPPVRSPGIPNIFESSSFCSQASTA
jgi:hypothetical protein